MRKNSQLILGILAVIMLVSLACEIPFFGKESTVQESEQELAAPLQEEPSSVSGETLSQDPLPPTIVEVVPIPGSTAVFNQPFVFYFNQAMDKTSVQTGLIVSPEVKLAFEWLDDSTLSVIANEDFPLDEVIVFRLGQSIKAENGLNLQSEQELVYRSPVPLRVTDQLPNPGSQSVNPSGVVMLAFNQPVVSLGEETDLAAFTLSPPVEGHGEWVNTSTYAFYPDLGLGGGVEYSLSINENLVSLSGAALQLSEGQLPAWKFTTSLPKLLTVEPQVGEVIAIDAEFVLTFNQSMDTSSIEDNYSLNDGSGNRIDGQFSWNDDFSRMTFKPEVLLERASIVSLLLLSEAQGLGGTPIGTDSLVEFRTVGKLDISNFSPALELPLEIYDGFSSLQIHFTAPIAESRFEDLIAFQPLIGDPVFYINDPYTLVVSGYFAPQTDYTITISADMTDRWGAPMAAPYQRDFRTGRARSNLTLPMLQYGEQILFLTPDDVFLPALATNIRAVDLQNADLQLDEFIGFVSHRELFYDYTPVGGQRWRESMELGENINQQVDIPLTPSRGRLEPGLYYFDMDAPELEFSRQPFMLVVSYINIAIKRSESQVLIWAVDLRDGSLLSETEMRVYSAQLGDPITCLTDEQGICTIDFSIELDPYDPLVVVAGKPGETDFAIGLDNWGSGINGWDFGFATYRRSEDTMAYLYTDRPIYRPGQEVFFRIIVRDADNGRYSIAPLSQIQVEVYGDYVMETGEVPLLDTIPISLSSFGTGTGEFILPEDAATGNYSIRIREIEDSMLNFQVAEYRKPEIDLQASFASQEMLRGEDLKALVEAEYYFGARAGSVPVHWTLFAQPTYFAMPYGYITGVQNLDWFSYGYWQAIYSELGNFVLEGDGQTGGDGRFEFVIPYDDISKYLDTESIQQLNLEVTIKDESEIPVSTQASLRLHPASFYIGIRSEQWNGRAGLPLGFAVQTADWDGYPSPKIQLSANLQKIKWVRVTDEASGFTSTTPEFTSTGSVDFSTDQMGQARISLTPQEPGMYLLDIKGGNARSQQLVWVGGSGSALWPNLPNQQLTLTLDQEVYRAGENAIIFIPNPFEEALALITVERGNVMRYVVLPVSDPQLEYVLPILPEDAPNIYVGVTLLNQAGTSKLDFRQGYANLAVQPEEFLLKVEILADSAQQSPGEAMVLTLRVSDNEGSPIQGEFSLALVDKALLALAEPNAENIAEAFYGSQPLGVINGLSLAAYTGRIPRSVLDGMGGGGGGLSIPPFVRQDFRDTAFWEGQIVTDEDGVAEITIDLPDNLTTWVAILRGLTADTRVGETQTEVVVSKDLLIRPVTPRFAVVGDHIQIGAIIQNNTSDSLPVDVTLQVSGMILDENQAELQRVIVSAGGSMRVNWWGTVQSVDQLGLLFSAQSGNLSDATLSENGEISVLHYSFPQTFGTSGVLSESGEVLEVISLPRSYSPTDGEVTVEIAPSLAAAILKDMEVLETNPGDFTESILSQVLPNVEMMQVINTFGLESPALVEELTQEIQTGIERLTRNQNPDGGWGWNAAAESDVYITSYVLFGFTQAIQAGFIIASDVIGSTQDYLLQNLSNPANLGETWQLDRLVFQYFALYESGVEEISSNELVGYVDRLNPWSKALLGILQASQFPGNETFARIENDIQSMAITTSTGVHWNIAYPASENYTTTVFNSAVVIYALARLDPASSLLPGAVRYLVAHRRVNGGWSSSYETAWSLLGLIEVMKGTGELQSNYTFSALLNGQPLISGETQGVDTLTAIISKEPLDSLIADTPNALLISRGAGGGKLYYRAYLQVDQPVEQAEPIQRGVAISRSYLLLDGQCLEPPCETIQQYSLSEQDVPVTVRLTVIVPEEMHYLVVEDWVPAGAEIVDTNLLTSQQGVSIPAELNYNDDLFSSEWQSWYFSQPQIYDDHIRWTASWLPAGTYTLTYRMTPYLEGDFHVIPARTYQYYFPEIQGSSTGEVFSILQ